MSSLPRSPLGSSTIQLVKMEQRFTLLVLIAAPTLLLTIPRRIQQQNLKSLSFNFYHSSYSGNLTTWFSEKSTNCNTFPSSGNRVLNQTVNRTNEIVATAPSQLIVEPKVGSYSCTHKCTMSCLSQHDFDINLGRFRNARGNNFI